MDLEAVVIKFHAEKFENGTNIHERRGCGEDKGFMRKGLESIG